MTCDVFYYCLTSGSTLPVPHCPFLQTLSTPPCLLITPQGSRFLGPGLLAWSPGPVGLWSGGTLVWWSPGLHAVTNKKINNNNVYIIIHVTVRATSFMPIVHTKRPGQWTLGSGPWTVDPGQWTLDSGPWTVDPGQWILDSGPWTVDPGQWTLDSGPWTVDPGQLTLDS